MQRQYPLVSIGVPVYNGERFLAATLDSLLNQTYPELEIIISDNGSTDGTAEICRRYSAQDPRVRYYRSEVNRGASWNYNRTFELASGKYFRWNAHDDKCEATYIEKCVAVLESRPDVVLAFTWVLDIDDRDQPLCVKQTQTDATAPKANRRFWGLSLVHPAHNCEEVFGLIRADVLRKTKLIDNYTDSDRTLLADLGLHGPFYEIPEALFLHRLHDTSSVVVQPNRHERTLWFNPAAKGRIVFPNWRQLRELLLVVWRSPLSWSERLLCYGHMVRWAKRRRRYLGADVTWALRRMIYGSTQ
jgi:glycosyltransferase involved in cell wall biosynthesis